MQTDIIKDFKLKESGPISVVSFIGFSQSETASNLHSIANAIVEKNVFGQVCSGIDKALKFISLFTIWE